MRRFGACGQSDRHRRYSFGLTQRCELPNAYFSPCHCASRLRPYLNKYRQVSILSESWTKNGDVPKSPFLQLIAPLPSAGTILLSKVTPAPISGAACIRILPVQVLSRIEMQNLKPRHVNESESDNRGIKEGWYAMRRNGTFELGPFSNRAECMTEIEKSTPEPASRLNRPGNH